ncbi:4598_t:CDS:2, partial [Acaulospora morrowiae]
YPAPSRKKVNDVVALQSDRCGSPRVVIVRERALRAQERKIRYKFGSTPKQERDWEGRKVQENTRKKGMKAINSEPIRHFVPHPRQSKWSWTGLQEWHNTGNQKVSEWIAVHL